MSGDCRQTADARAHGKQVVEYCADCGDVAPGVPYIADGPLRDPAHTYVRTSDDRFDRLCGTDALRVSEETATGILIVPDPVATSSAASAVPDPIGSLAIAFVLGACATVTVRTLRRRRPMEPRAARLG